MALQLSIYPQTLEGTYNYVSQVNNFELVHDPNFIYASAVGMPTQSVGGATPALTAMMDAAYLPTYKWQAYHSSGGGFAATQAPTFSITNSGARLNLQCAVGGNTGVYQKVTGLLVGHNYDVRVVLNNSGTAGSFFWLGNWAGGPFQASGIWHYPIPATGGVVTAHPDITGTLSYTFTAQKTEEVLILDWMPSQDSPSSLQIKKVSIKESPSTSAPELVNVDDGQVILDLMDANSIPMSLSIDNFKNVGEKPQSYSKAFNLPSTKHNNKIFTSLYDVTRSVKSDNISFNLHKQTRAILKDNGFPIFEGYLKLIGIKEKNGVPSYNVNLFSDSISLKSVLSKKTFADFDGGTLGGGYGFDELGHDYNLTNVALTWSGALPITALPTGYTGSAGVAGATTTNVLKYPYCIWNTNHTVADGVSPVINAGSPVLSALSDAFRPFIKIKYLWDRIFSEAGFSYSSDFLNTTDFTRLYMDFSWGKEPLMTPTTNTANGALVGSAAAVPLINVGTSYQNIQLNSGFPSWNNSGNYFSTTATTALEDIGYNTTTHVFTAPNTTTTYNFDISIAFMIDAASATFMTRVFHQDSDGNMIYVPSFTHAGSVGVTEIWNWTGTIVCNAGDTIKFQVKNNSAAVPGISQQPMFGWSGLAITGVNHFNVIADIEPQLSSSSLLTKRGKIKQWDFIKDLFNMFNLVAMQDRQNPNNLIIEPYKDVFLDTTATSDPEHQSQYISINILDWTEKVDMDSMEISAMKLKERIKFDYKKPKDYANKNYTEDTGLQFGSFQIDATDFDLAKGEQKIALKVFSPTFLTPVFDDFNVKLTVPHITGGEVDTGANGGVENNPRILYDATWTSVPSPMSISPDEYHVPAHGGVGAYNASSFGLFSHLSRHPSNASTLDYNFGSHQIVGYGGSPPINNLFNTYWQPYFDELYHPDTRVVKFNIALNSQDVSTFNFNDQIRIKNRLYRANKIDYKPKALSKVELILLP